MFSLNSWFLLSFLHDDLRHGLPDFLHTRVDVCRVELASQAEVSFQKTLNSVLLKAMDWIENQRNKRNSLIWNSGWSFWISRLVVSPLDDVAVVSASLDQKMLVWKATGRLGSWKLLFWDWRLQQGFSLRFLSKTPFSGLLKVHRCLRRRLHEEWVCPGKTWSENHSKCGCCLFQLPSKASSRVFGCWRSQKRQTLSIHHQTALNQPKSAETLQRGLTNFGSTLISRIWPRNSFLDMMPRDKSYTACI